MCTGHAAKQTLHSNADCPVLLLQRTSAAARRPRQPLMNQCADDSCRRAVSVLPLRSVRDVGAGVWAVYRQSASNVLGILCSVIEQPWHYSSPLASPFSSKPFSAF